MLSFIASSVDLTSVFISPAPYRVQLRIVQVRGEDWQSGEATLRPGPALLPQLLDLRYSVRLAECQQGSNIDTVKFFKFYSFSIPSTHLILSLKVVGPRQCGRRPTLGHNQRDLRAELDKKGRRRIDAAEA